MVGGVRKRHSWERCEACLGDVKRDERGSGANEDARDRRCV
jgi:hypothetical protein